MGLVVAVPAAQGGVAGIGKKKLQRRRFNVAVAKYLFMTAVLTHQIHKNLVSVSRPFQRCPAMFIPDINVSPAVQQQFYHVIMLIGNGIE